VLLSRSRYLAPAAQTLRFYREYFKPSAEREIEKDRRRWLVAFQGEEFFVNLDRVLKPSLPGFYLEIKARTWSRRDAEDKASLMAQLLAVLGASSGQPVREEYVELAAEAA
jgi:5-methylthioadenosine/S-adenosylhomocysteine deaminase